MRDPARERPGFYAVDKAGLVFKAESGDDYNGAKAWVAVDPDLHGAPLTFGTASDPP